MLLESTPLELNTDIIPFRLLGTDGKWYTPDDFCDKKILVIIFMCNHCPYVKAVIDRFVRFQATYQTKGIQLIGINPNDEITYPEDSYDNMKKFYVEHKMNFPYLRDESQEIARAYNAVCTPDIYVYDVKRKLKYHGRFDDNWKDETKVTRKDLELAVEKLLKGEEIEFTQYPSMGCSIKWK